MQARLRSTYASAFVESALKWVPDEEQKVRLEPIHFHTEGDAARQHGALRFVAFVRYVSYCIQPVYIPYASHIPFVTLRTSFAISPICWRTLS